MAVHLAVLPTRWMRDVRSAASALAPGPDVVRLAGGVALKLHIAAVSVLVFGMAVATVMLTSCWLSRPDLQLPRSTYMGVHDRSPDPERFPAMACLRAPDDVAAVAMDRERKRRRDPAHRRLLDLASSHVHHQLRAGGLGDS